MGERLVCVRPGDTVDFEYGGGIFKVGIMPRDIYAKWLDLGQKQVKGKATGREIVEAQMLVVKHCVKGHSGLEFSDGSEVPFEKDNQGLVAQATLDVYYATGILGPLASRSANGEEKEGDSKNGEGVDEEV